MIKVLTGPAVFALALNCVVSHVTRAHPPEEQVHPETLISQGLILPRIEGPSPWSEKPLLNDDNRFQIAIMTDRTGGHRPGVWMNAVRRVNMLRPEFVMSVGDLIEGYTEDQTAIKNQWKEFLGFVDNFEMKFFFVAGNHDLTNPTMQKMWRDRFGPTWYSFDYKGVHFLCLCTEDPVTQIGEEQLTWIKRDLSRHRDARWTLVFMHKPLWVTAERALAAGNKDKTNWSQVQAWLGDRPHTVFAGHVHHYTQFDRNEQQYYQLATTGGGSQLRGPLYGEFDHIMWLTMEKEGPHVTILLLNGILPADVVTEKSMARFRAFLAKTRLEVAPILIDDEDGFNDGRIDMRLTNEFDEPVEISGHLVGLPLKGLRVDPEQLHLAAAAGKTNDMAVSVRFQERMPFDNLAGTIMSVTLRSRGEGPSLVAERTLPVIIDRKHELLQVVDALNIDGDLSDWKRELRFHHKDEPLVLGAAESWQGKGDASAAFDVGIDGEHLYFGVRVTDDRVLPQDRLELRVDFRPITERAADQRLVRGTYLITIPAPAATDAPELNVENSAGKSVRTGIRGGTKLVENGYSAEASLPLKMLIDHQGNMWSSLQLALVVRDIDEAGQKPCRIVWRGTADVARRNRNYGHFVRP